MSKIGRPDFRSNWRTYDPSDFGGKSKEDIGTTDVLPYNRQQSNAPDAKQGVKDARTLLGIRGKALGSVDESTVSGGIAKTLAQRVNNRPEFANYSYFDKAGTRRIERLIPGFDQNKYDKILQDAVTTATNEFNENPSKKQQGVDQVRRLGLTNDLFNKTIKAELRKQYKNLS